MLEATHRQFPALVAAARRGGSHSDCALEVACPWVTSNKGFSLCLLKRTFEADGSTSDAEMATRAAEAAELESQLERFARDDLTHTRAHHAS